ncbi:VOC family protein [Jiangella rhizosphaerae]|uniref:VOC family protein n=1 Tax=Jiangella rhizosphaerae TaxID=2293569 RepID=A0A418KLS4_9ACTN|nr:VOC family protein [Jiangella rhizosphaerae]RIQ18896.1 VOC family protein [Jiangella rhizosphaerae]
MATVTPYLCARNAAAALDFYAAAFGAVETTRWTDPSTGTIGHAEFTVEGARIMLADEWPEGGVYAPDPGRSSVSLVLEVGDVDGLFERAVAAGATVDRPVADSPHGRNGWLVDPFGHRWNLTAPEPDVSTDDLRAAVGDDYVIS